MSLNNSHLVILITIHQQSSHGHRYPYLKCHWQWSSIPGRWTHPTEGMCIALDQEEEEGDQVNDSFSPGDLLECMNNMVSVLRVRKFQPLWFTERRDMFESHWPDHLPYLPGLQLICISLIHENTLRTNQQWVQSFRSRHWVSGSRDERSFISTEDDSYNSRTKETLSNISSYNAMQDSCRLSSHYHRKPKHIITSCWPKSDICDAKISATHSHQQ